MHRLDSDEFRKFVTCKNCLYSDTLGIIYDANDYCIEYLCDHAPCPECGSSYHAISNSPLALVTNTYNEQLIYWPSPTGFMGYLLPP